MSNFIFAFEIIGVVAFAIAGALEAIKAKMDFLGVLILSCITALGGGIVRDLVLGIHPPNAFRNPIYLYIAALSSVVVFILAYRSGKVKAKTVNKIFENTLMILDAIGLAVFTVLGMNVAFNQNLNNSGVLYIFVGMITGVGGGMIRDILLLRMPYILDRDVYASASLIGGLVYFCMRRYTNIQVAFSMLICIFLIIFVRILALRYKWKLPKATQDRS
ncbi:trimeric intracellular cation channel family protein [Peptoniphilaceae bacterium SGI.131]